MSASGHHPYRMHRQHAHTLDAGRLDLGFAAHIVIVNEHDVLAPPPVKKTALDHPVRIETEFAQMLSADIVLSSVVKHDQLREDPAQVRGLDLLEGAENAPCIEKRKPEVVRSSGSLLLWRLQLFEPEMVMLSVRTLSSPMRL